MKFRSYFNDIISVICVSPKATNSLRLFAGPKIKHQPRCIQDFAQSLGVHKVQVQQIYDLVLRLPANRMRTKDVFSFITEKINKGKNIHEKSEIAGKIVDGLKLSFEFLENLFGKEEYVELDFWDHAKWVKFNPLFEDPQHAFVKLLDVAFILQSAKFKIIMSKIISKILERTNKAAESLHTHPSSERREGRRHREIGILTVFAIEKIRSVLNSKKINENKVINEVKMIDELNLLYNLPLAAEYHIKLIMSTERYDAPIWWHPLVRRELWEVSLAFVQFLKSAEITDNKKKEDLARKLRKHLRKISKIRPKGEFFIGGLEDLPVMLNLFAQDISYVELEKFDAELRTHENYTKEAFGTKAFKAASEGERIAIVMRAALDEQAAQDFLPQETIMQRFSAVLLDKGGMPVEKEGKSLIDGAFVTMATSALSGDVPLRWKRNWDRFIRWRSQWNEALNRVQQRMLERASEKVSFLPASGTVEERIFQAIISHHLLIPEEIEKKQRGEVRREISIPIFRTDRGDAILFYDSIFALNNYSAYVMIKLMELQHTSEHDKRQTRGLNKQIRDAIGNTIEIIEALRRALISLDVGGNALNIHRDALYYHINGFLSNLHELVDPAKAGVEIEFCRETFNYMALLDAGLGAYEKLLKDMDAETLLFYYKRLKLMELYEDFSTIGIEKDLHRIPRGSFPVAFIDVRNESVPAHLRTIIVGRPAAHGLALNTVKEMLEFMREVEDTHGVPVDEKELDNTAGYRGWIARVGDELTAFVCDNPPKEKFKSIKQKLLRLGFKEKNIIAIKGGNPSEEQLGISLQRTSKKAEK